MEPGCPVGSDPSADARPSRRFDSWKEIAVYFGRDVRTVRRWEKTEALPVHRHLHRSRGSVYAFQDELDHWHRRRSEPAVSSRRLPRGALFVAIPSILGLTAGAFVLNDRLASPSMFPEREQKAAAAGDPNRSRLPVDPEVREIVLLARHQLDRRAGFRQEARESLQRAIERAPDFAEAHALLGEAYVRQALFDRSPHVDAWSKAEAAVRRALALDDGLATAHVVLGRILLLRDWNWPVAAAECLRAMELDPESPEARSAYALYLRSAGRVAEAVVERARAQRVDPLNPQRLTFLGDEYLFARRFDDAVRSYERALQLERDYRPAVASLADVWARIGRHDEAATWQRRSLVLREQQDLGAAFDEVRQRNGARAALEWLDRWNLREFRRAPDQHLWDLAYSHARLGHRDAALQFLERAYERRDPGLLQARVDPDLDSLRADPRFVDLLQRIGPQ